MEALLSPASTLPPTTGEPNTQGQKQWKQTSARVQMKEANSTPQLKSLIAQRSLILFDCPVQLLAVYLVMKLQTSVQSVKS